MTKAATSMATPHVSGVAAYALNVNIVYLHAEVVIIVGIGNPAEPDFHLLVAI